MPKTCLKCNYTRQAADRAPDFECPHCGAIYSKVEAASNRNEATREQAIEYVSNAAFNETSWLGGRGFSIFKITFALLIATLILIAISNDRSETPPHNRYVGNMDDHSYAGNRYQPYGPNAHGEEVAITDFEGNFIWVDYAAPWCSACIPQSQAIKALEHSLGGEIVFLTVMTSDQEVFSAATVNTAKKWASRFGLEATQVVAGKDTVRFIPTHYMYSPNGQTLYHHSGPLSAKQIRTTLTQHIANWNG